MDKHLKTANFLARLLDTQFNIFGIKFGIDPLLGLFPGIGDLITIVLGLYLIVIAFELNLPASKIIQMLFNILIDFLIGLIPVLGDLFDFAFKANTRNLEIIRKHLGEGQRLK